MDLLHAAAVLLLSVFAYSVGRAAGTAAERPRPRPADVLAAPLAAAVLLAASLLTAAALGLLVAALGGFLAGLSLGALREALPGPRPAGTGRPAAGGEEPSGRRYLLRVGELQGRLFLALFYFLLVPPFALILRLGPDPLALEEPREGGSGYWRAAEAPGDDGLRRPY